jgi:hypothetical protein
MNGEYIIIKQNRYMRVFRKAGATDRSGAQSLSGLGLHETGVFRRMVDKGVFVDTGLGTYYMDPKAAEQFIVARRKRAFFALILILIVLLLLWAFNGRLFR